MLPLEECSVEGPWGTYIPRRIWRRPSNSVPLRKDSSPLGGTISAGSVQTAATTPNSSPVILLSEVKCPKRVVRSYAVDNIKTVLFAFPDEEKNENIYHA